MIRSAISLAAGLVFFALLAAPAPAQTYLGFNMAGGVPMDDFQDHLDDVGIGVSGALLVGFGPVAVGLEGGFLTYGQRAVPLPARLDAASATLGRIETKNQIGQLLAVLRLQAPSGVVRPYADGLFGFNYFVTRTVTDQAVVVVDADVDILNLDLGDGGGIYEQTTRSNVLDDFALSYGVGGGLLVRVAQGTDDGTPWQAFLDLGVRYLLGGEAQYLREGGVIGGGSPPAALVAESETTLIRPQLGLVVQFGR